MAPQHGLATMLVGGPTESLILPAPIGRGLMVLALAAFFETGAGAQTPSAPVPDLSAPNAAGQPTVQAVGQPPVQWPGAAPAGLPAGGDLSALSTALAAAKRGDSSGVQAAMAQISDPVARKLAQWAMIDAEGEQLPFYALDQARRDLAGWPRAGRRQMVAEKALGASGLAPAQVIAWFGADEPQTAEGAMALASAYQLSGRPQDAETLIRRWWRTRVFEADVQRAMLSRFGGFLTPDDHAARMETLLYDSQGPATQDMTPLLTDDQRALAQARLALRNESFNAPALANALPASVSEDPGLAVDRAIYLLHHDLDAIALQSVAYLPTNPPNPDAASRIWVVRRSLIGAALKVGDYATAYAAATNHGLPAGADYCEAEFYAGWIALEKLHNAAAAEIHFANIQASGSAPITQARALYWRGRAAEAQGDQIGAADFFTQASRYYTTFYGQLAADRAGVQRISLGHDPVPSPADRARFDGREPVRAARLLASLGEKDLFRTFILCLGDTPLAGGEEYALLVDLAGSYGDQDLAMRAVRLAAQHDFVLPDRGYPVRAVPNPPDAAEAALVFGITRQESGFDPRVRSPVGARGMMQLMPATAASTARLIGEPYRADMLDDPDYNMRLGAAYMGKLVSDFNGSYLMATAAYNAGPGRPMEWAGYCGDPRASSSDPVDFIECIPISETRNYVMRVLEAAQVYRARLNGGSAPLSLAADLKRGGYGFARQDGNHAEVVSLIRLDLAAPPPPVEQTAPVSR
jgi:soluble lytic murein transglycosylase